MKDLAEILKELPDHDIPQPDDHPTERKHGPVRPDPAAIANLDRILRAPMPKPPGRAVST